MEWSGNKSTERSGGADGKKPGSGMQERDYPVKKMEVQLSFLLKGTLYEPLAASGKEKIGFVTNYIMLKQGEELAMRGYPTLTIGSRENLRNNDELMADIGCAIQYMRQRAGIETVIALSWSGGCSTLSAYQSIAENGVQVFQDPRMLFPVTDIGEQPEADALVFLDSNWGNGAMALFSLDPAVIGEDGGIRRNAALDIYNPANGYNPDGASVYPEAFVAAVQKAQAARMNRLIDFALERAARIDAGEGNFADDEPMVIPGGSHAAPFNKIFPQDLRYLHRTQDSYPLLHADGSVTVGRIVSVREAKPFKNQTGNYHGGAYVTTVKNFLRTCAVRAGEDFACTADGVRGIGWDGCYTCTPGNVKHIHCPALILGMTGNYEYLAAETIYRNMAGGDKTVAFVEGATHMLSTNRAAEQYSGQYGDTRKTVFDYVDRWAAEKFL